MKKLEKIRLKDQVLSKEEMKKVVGLGLTSGTSSGSGAWCCIDGECVGPFTSCSDSYCQQLYGPGAYCD